jgi:exopolysaccharide production protein ExoZ
VNASLPVTPNVLAVEPVAPQRAAKRGLVVESLDAWRGFAALWVVLVHAVVPTMLTRFPEIAQSTLYRFPLYGALGVPIFFVISGFCIANAAVVLVGSPNGSRRFVRARFRRLYPPYIVMTAIAFIAAIGAGFAVRAHVLASSALALENPLKQGWVYYFSALTMTQIPLNQTPILAPFWSLSYEACFYAIVLAGLVLASRSRRIDLVTLLHGVTALSILLFIVNPGAAFFPLDRWMQFGVGVLLYDLLRNPGQLRPRIVAAVLTVGILVGCALHPQLGWAGIDKPAMSIQLLTCLATALLIWLTAGIDRQLLRFMPVRWLAKVGTFSYSLYLSHFLVLGIVLQAFKRLHYTEHTFIIVFLAEVAVSVVAGYGFYRICEVHFTSKKAKRIHQEATLTPLHDVTALA